MSSDAEPAEELGGDCHRRGLPGTEVQSTGSRQGGHPESVGSHRRHPPHSRERKVRPRKPVETDSGAALDSSHPGMQGPWAGLPCPGLASHVLCCPGNGGGVSEHPTPTSFFPSPGARQDPDLSLPNSLGCCSGLPAPVPHLSVTNQKPASQWSLQWFSAPNDTQPCPFHLSLAASQLQSKFHQQPFLLGSQLAKFLVHIVLLRTR